MLRLGLRTKFFLYSNTLIVVTMGIVTVLTVVRGRQNRYDEIRSRGISLAETSAVPITDAFLYEDLGLVNEDGLIEDYITGILDRNRGLALYVIVTDARGTVTHSNLVSLIGKRFERALDRSAVGEPTAVEATTFRRGEQVLEFRTPLAISTRYWGSLVLGVSLAPVEEEVRAVAKRAGLVALVLLLGNSILTALYVETLIRPILSLHNTMRQAGRGDLSARADVRRWDEVGELAAAFNRMMVELGHARERDSARRAQLAHTEKMASLGTLAAGVAHEVNNPLAGILTCLEAIRADPGDAEMRDRYLGLVEDGIKRIEHTVLNLLDLARTTPVRLEPTSLNLALHHVAELVQYQVLKGHVEVVFDLSTVEPAVLADRFQMDQLFLNLVLNAIQAMPHGGVLTLRTRVEEREVVVEVSDTGVGVPEAIRDRIFDPFFSTREVGQGTGLGLAVSYNIVAAHGGRIGLDSEEGKGTTFRVALPLDRPGTKEETAS